MAAIPSDNHIRQMLDGSSPGAFDGLFIKALETVAAADGLSAFQRLGGRLLIALDATEHFCSRKISCPRCSTRRRSDGGVECIFSALWCCSQRQPVSPDGPDPVGSPHLKVISPHLKVISPHLKVIMRRS
jgi:hypothetical protein